MATLLKKPNLTLIAARCGVSKMTVSRVFRNDPNVSAQTRQAVLRMAEGMNFIPSKRVARQPKETVRDYAVLFHREYSSTDTYFGEIIRTVQQELFAHTCGCWMATLSGEYADFLALTAMLKARRTHGVCIVGEVAANYVTALLADYTNLMLLDYAGTPAIGRPFNAVYPDQVYGAHLATKHLLSLGRERILLLCGKPNHYFSTDLIAGYRNAMAEAGRAVSDHGIIVHADHHRRGGYHAIRAALAEGKRFDAILSNDEMACGALTALDEAGRKVPDDVAIVGFDGLPLGEDVRPTLSTMRIDRQAMGRLAVERLLALDLDNPGAPTFERIAMFPELIVRESCGGAARSAVPKETAV